MCSPIWVPGILVLIGLNSPRMLDGRIGLGIPDIDVGRPALQEDHDHVLGAPKPRAPAYLLATVAACACVAPEEEVRQIQAHDADGADAQQLAPRGSFAVCSRGVREDSA